MWQFRVESASTVTKWRSRISIILDLFKMSKIRDFPISYVHLHTSFFAIPLQSPQPPMTLSLESRGPKNNNPLQVLTKVTAVGRHRHWNSHFIIFHPFHAILPLTVGSVHFFFNVCLYGESPIDNVWEWCVTPWHPWNGQGWHSVHLGSPTLQWHSHTKHHLGRCHPSPKIVWDTVTKLAFFLREKSWWPCMWIARSY